ncbi:TPA: Panacea domain-containing protein [Streptococcus suis]
MANIIDVACYILEKKPDMTAMKLQKLCYYAQAWSLAWDLEALFDEDFYAWPSGPVCPLLYELHKDKFIVNYHDLSSYKTDWEFCDHEIATLDAIIRDYGDEDNWWLSDLTRMEEPWKQARGDDLFSSPYGRVIPKALMYSYYSDLITE